MKIWTLTLLFAACADAAGPGWWTREPIRWVQSNLREVDAATDPAALVDEAVRLRANVLHLGMGGISAYYPTRVPFHYPSPFLPANRDFFGEALQRAHAKKVRVVGRFDFSKTRKEVYDAHPEWFFRKADGSPVIYNGLYSTCINGDWYQRHVFDILDEALTLYDVDGLFFNMFGNQSRDYSGNLVGHCRCGACARKFRSLFGREIPETPDADYARFLSDSARDVSRRIGELIHRKRPGAGYFNYILETTDGVMSESNTAASRPLPLWPYMSSDNVNRARNSQPRSASVNLNMQFFDFPWRYATVSPHEIALRLWQNVAHGGALAFAINGTFDLNDRQALESARPVFGWAAENETYLGPQESAARVLLLAGSDQHSYRGWFRMLSEEHIPFAVSTNMDWLGHREFDLVIAADRAPKSLERFVSSGGRVLVASSQPPEFLDSAGARTEPDVKGYIRIRDKARFPSLALTSLVMLDGPFTSVPSQSSPGPLSLVPPSMFGPPEKIHQDLRDSATPALLSYSEGRVTWLPWNAAALYYRHSLPGHRGLLRDLLAEVLKGRRQLETNAHPLVEISLMKQPGSHLLHIINLSGHSQTAWFAPVPMREIAFSLRGRFASARALRAGKSLPVRFENGSTTFSLPSLDEYELVILE
jgi:hypothetical protein